MGDKLTPKAAQIDEDTVLAGTSPAGLAFVATKSDPRPYVPAEFHLIMAQAMVDLEQHRLDALFMSVPVRHGKTRLGSNIMPAWFLGLHPDREILAASHAAEFAADKVGGPARDFFVRTSKRYFGVTIDPLANARGRWKTSGGGGMRAVGVQQGIAGQGADLAIVDDPYANVEDAMNRRQRDKAWEWYQAEFVTRCSPGAPHIHIMSRWNVDDHMARALEQAKEAKLRYRVLDFPALAICPKCDDYGVDAVNQCGHGIRDSLGRLPGEALWPQERPRDFLLQQRIRTTPRFFDALYQGRPRPDAGAIFRREWFRRYHIIGPRIFLHDEFGRVSGGYDLHQCRIFMTVDLAAGTSSTDGDFTVFGVFALGPKHELIVLDWFRDRIDGTRQIPMLRAYWNKHRAVRIGVEAVAYQWVFIQNALAEGLPIVAIKRGREGKETRSLLVASRYEMGQVFHPLPADAPWVVGMENELIDFPVGAHDDQVDVMSDAGAVVAEAETRPMAIGVQV
jgi:predicted phage terminase large subunit-like protein